MGHLALCILAPDHLGCRRIFLTGTLDNVGVLLNDFGHRLRQPEQPAIHKAVQQGIASGEDQNREDQEQHCHQNERRLADQTMKRLHVADSASSSMYPAPRTVAINWGEKSRSIFARRARIWASTMFVMGS